MGMEQVMNNVRYGNPNPTYAGRPGFKSPIAGLPNTPEPWEELSSTDRMVHLQDPALGNLNFYGSSPHASGLQDFIKSISGSYTGGSYKAKDRMGEQLPEYNAMRARIDSRYKREGQAAQESMDRQFAAMGGGPSGAQVKQTQNLAAELARVKGEEMLGLDAEEAKARRGLQEAEGAREFQSGETARGYGFQASQNAQQMKLAGLTGLAKLDLDWKTAQKEAMNDTFNKILAQFQNRRTFAGIG